MQPLEYCLDYILNELEKNWNVDGADKRRYLSAEHTLIQFGLPDYYRKHEFFIRLIDKLVNDGYAEFIDTNDLIQKQKITFYQENTIITIEGFYFIKEKGGYSRQKAISTAENSRLARLENQQRMNRNWMLWLTAVLTLGTLAQASLAVTELYWKYQWFFWPFFSK